MGLGDFEVIQGLGKGAFARVDKVRVCLRVKGKGKRNEGKDNDRSGPHPNPLEKRSANQASLACPT